MQLSVSHPPKDRLLPLQQHPLFQGALRYLNRKSECLCADQASALVIRRGMGFSSRGPIWADCTDFQDQVSVLGQLARRGLRLVNAESEHQARALRQAGYGQIMTAAYVAELDLRPERDNLRAGMFGKWRNRLVRSEQATKGGEFHINQTRFNLRQHSWFLAKEQEQRKKRRYHALPLGLIPALAAANPDALRLFEMTQNDQPIAATMFVRHGPMATYLVGWTSAEGRQVHAHNQLMWQAMCHYQNHKTTMLDLGQVDTETSPGLARFKIGTGAHVRPLGGTWLRLSPFAPPTP